MALADYVHSEPDLDAAFAQIRGRAAHRGAEAAVGGAQLARMVRGGRALSRPRSGAVQLFAADPLAAHQPREFAAARSRMAGRRRGLVPAPGRRGGNGRAARRCSRRSGCASWSSTNRVVVSPMAQYKAVDGCPTDWHFAHYAERAKGGAGLVYIEMTCVSPEGRITPGCTGFYAPEHEVAWKRLVDFVHAETEAKICAQIGHSGAEGLDPARLGGERRAAGDRQLAGDGGLRRAVVAAQPDAEGDGPRRHGHGARPVRGVGRDGGRAAASTCSRSTPRTAICCRPSSRR